MKIRKKAIIIFVSIIILAIGLVGYLIFKEKPIESKKAVEIIDSIEGYDYKLEDRDTVLYKDNFLLLKSTLEKDVVNFTEYAELISKLFIIDLYTINNKINKYDVGSIDFVYPQVIENYSLNVKDTLYKYLEDNSDNNRKQELPEVENVEVKNIEEVEYIYNKNKMMAYEIELSWSYKKDLDYDKSGVIVIVKQNEMLYIIEKRDI